MENFEDEMEWKLRGYFSLPRGLFNELIKRKITPDQCYLLIIYIAFASWDNRHKKYAVSDISNRRVAKILGWGKDKVGINKGFLFGRKYIDLLKGDYKQMNVKIKNPGRYYAKLTDKVSDTKDTVSSPKDTRQM